MNDKFNEQKDTLVSLKHEISLLQQQVDFLLRNEKPLGLLDLDVMMNRTHSIYDQLCSIDISDIPYEEETEDRSQETEDIPLEPEEEEAIKSLFGIEEEPEEPIHVVGNVEEAVQSDPNDFGFILNFEPAEESVEKTEDGSQKTEDPAPVYTTGDEIEMSIPQMDIPYADAPISNTPEEEIPYEPVIIGNMEEKEDSSFELDQPETIADRLQQQEDHSLAAKLQHEAAVKDLRTAIGINDKFLLVNELFGGSMEKYNKSIENLNDLKTLNGALIYMNELRIELQWNSSNEAYQKLLELVHRKFEA